MKVLHLVPAMEQGGVETVVCDLNRIVVDRGWESVVVSSGGRLVGRIESDGGRHLTLDVKSKNPLTYFLRAARLRRLLKAEKPDLVCAHSRVPAWLFVWANRSLGLKWITYAHGANSVSRYSAVMTKGDLTVTPSRFLADFLKDNYGLAEEKVRVISPAVDTKRFDPDNLDKDFIEQKRREWGIRPGDFVVMAVGRLTKVKGFDHLIKETPAGHKLVIVGGADSRHRDYERYLRSLAGPNVVFAGQQEKIPECLSIADEVVSANTTKPESFGLSVAEAYAMNRPVRAKRFGGVAEIMAAVDSANTATSREAIENLYGRRRLAEETASLYAGVAGGAVRSPLEALLAKRLRVSTVQLSPLDVDCAWPVFKGIACETGPFFVKLTSRDAAERTLKLLRKASACSLLPRLILDDAPQYGEYAVLCLEWKPAERMNAEDLTDSQLDGFLSGCLDLSQALNMTPGVSVAELGDDSPEVQFDALFRYVESHPIMGRFLKPLVDLPAAERSYGWRRLSVIHGDLQPKNYGFTDDRMSVVYDTDDLTTGLPCEDASYAFTERIRRSELPSSKKMRLYRLFLQMVKKSPWPVEEWRIAVNHARLRIAARRLRKHSDSLVIAVDIARRDAPLRRLAGLLKENVC